MPDSESGAVATTSPHEALRQLGAFMRDHEAHGGKADIKNDAITLWCDAHTPPVYEILTMDRMELRWAMGQELSEHRVIG